MANTFLTPPPHPPSFSLSKSYLFSKLLSSNTYIHCCIYTHMYMHLNLYMYIYLSITLSIFFVAISNLLFFFTCTVRCSVYLNLNDACACLFQIKQILNSKALRQIGGLFMYFQSHALDKTNGREGISLLCPLI